MEVKKRRKSSTSSTKKKKVTEDEEIIIAIESESESEGEDVPSKKSSGKHSKSKKLLPLVNEGKSKSNKPKRVRKTKKTTELNLENINSNLKKLNVGYIINFLYQKSYATRFVKLARYKLTHPDFDDVVNIGKQKDDEDSLSEILDLEIKGKTENLDIQNLLKNENFYLDVNGYLNLKSEISNVLKQKTLDLDIIKKYEKILLTIEEIVHDKWYIFYYEQKLQNLDEDDRADVFGFSDKIEDLPTRYLENKLRGEKSTVEGIEKISFTEFKDYDYEGKSDLITKYPGRKFVLPKNIQRYLFFSPQHNYDESIKMVDPDESKGMNDSNKSKEINDFIYNLFKLSYNNNFKITSNIYSFGIDFFFENFPCVCEITDTPDDYKIKKSNSRLDNIRNFRCYSNLFNENQSTAFDVIIKILDFSYFTDSFITYLNYIVLERYKIFDKKSDDLYLLFNASKQHIINMPKENLKHDIEINILKFMKKLDDDNEYSWMKKYFELNCKIGTIETTEINRIIPDDINNINSNISTIIYNDTYNGILNNENIEKIVKFFSNNELPEDLFLIDENKISIKLFNNIDFGVISEIVYIGEKKIIANQIISVFCGAVNEVVKNISDVEISKRSITIPFFNINIIYDGDMSFKKNETNDYRILPDYDNIFYEYFYNIINKFSDVDVAKDKKSNKIETKEDVKNFIYIFKKKFDKYKLEQHLVFFSSCYISIKLDPETKKNFINTNEKDIKKFKEELENIETELIKNNNNDDIKKRRDLLIYKIKNTYVTGKESKYNQTNFFVHKKIYNTFIADILKFLVKKNKYIKSSIDDTNNEKKNIVDLIDDIITKLYKTQKSEIIADIITIIRGIIDNYDELIESLVKIFKLRTSDTHEVQIPKNKKRESIVINTTFDRNDINTFDFEYKKKILNFIEGNTEENNENNEEFNILNINLTENLNNINPKNILDNFDKISNFIEIEVNTIYNNDQYFDLEYCKKFLITMAKSCSKKKILDFWDNDYGQLKLINHLRENFDRFKEEVKDCGMFSFIISTFLINNNDIFIKKINNYESLRLFDKQKYNYKIKTDIASYEKKTLDELNLLIYGETQIFNNDEKLEFEKKFFDIQQQYHFVEFIMFQFCNYFISDIAKVSVYEEHVRSEEQMHGKEELDIQKHSKKIEIENFILGFITIDPMYEISTRTVNDSNFYYFSENKNNWVNKIQHGWEWPNYFDKPPFILKKFLANAYISADGYIRVIEEINTGDFLRIDFSHYSKRQVYDWVVEENFYLKFSNLIIKNKLLTELYVDDANYKSQNPKINSFLNYMYCKSNFVTYK